MVDIPTNKTVNASHSQEVNIQGMIVSILQCCYRVTFFLVESKSSHGSLSWSEYEFQPLENYQVRVIHARVLIRNRVEIFIVNLQNIHSKLKTDKNYMYFLLKKWARVESSLCFSSSSYLKFAPEMLQASSSESRDFQVLQSTSQARV